MGTRLEIIKLAPIVDKLSSKNPTIDSKIPPYGKGKASDKIINLLHKNL
jgi:UDP-N-acetylglucosamine 2-epimerase